MSRASRRAVRKRGQVRAAQRKRAPPFPPPPANAATPVDLGPDDTRRPRAAEEGSVQGPLKDRPEDEADRWISDRDAEGVEKP